MITRRPLSAVLWLLFAFCATFGNAQSPPCDSNIQPDGQQGEFTYRYYDENRCEGIFIQNVASSALMLTSFTSSYMLNAFGPGELTLSWPIPTSSDTFGAVSLRATSHVYKLYYQMDAFVENAHDGIYEWDTRIPSSLALTSSDLGLVARTDININDPTQEVDGLVQDVVLPLAASRQADGMPKSDTYSVVVMPQEELTSITYRLFPALQGYVADEDAQKPPILEGGPGVGYYPAGRPVAFALDLNLSEQTNDGEIDYYDEGIYYLEISVNLPDSRVSRLEIYFYEAAH